MPCNEKKPNLGSRMERCADWWVREPEGDAGPLARSGALLQDPCGSRWAVGRGGLRWRRLPPIPDMLLIAMERVPDAMVVAMEKARELDLRNVFCEISMWHD